MNPSSPPQSRLVGHIDSVEHGLVSGWAMDNANPDQAVELAVWCGSEVVASGTATMYRPDLVTAFGTSGNHGFGLPLHGSKLASGSSLVLRERSSNRPIAAPPFQLNLQAENVSVLGLRVAGVDLVVTTRNTGDPQLVRIALLDGDNIVDMRADTIGAGTAEWSLPLPGHLFDGRPHLLGVSLGAGAITARTAAILSSILTPWEHLRESHASTSVVGLLPLEAARYHSLRLQLADPERRIDQQTLVLAHEIVCELNLERREFAPLTLPVADEPVASVVIPAYDQFAATYHCVASLLLARNRLPFEIIIGDDGSTDETSRCEEYLRNVRVVRASSNSGFNATCNRAAAAARGRYLILLNNDTEVTSGWIDELVAAFDRFRRVGLAGAKLLNRDGSLQEAGCVVWASGAPWNVGSGGNAKAPEHNYARQVDYVSAAALCIPHEVWKQVGGFSKEFEPAYYEDTDLAFKVREAGYTTWYVPTSEVFHFEGLSSGRDVRSGVKRFQAVNAGKFKKKWVRAFTYHGPDGRDLHIHRDRGVVGRVLMLDATTSTPDRDAGSYAAVQEMRLLQQLGLKVTFVPENLAHAGEYTAELQRSGVEVIHAPFFISVRRFLEQRGSEFDLVYVTRHDVASRLLFDIRRCCRAKLVLNLADLHFLRELRAVAQGQQVLEQALAVRDAELEVLRKVDGILTYNETEKAVILSHNQRDDNIYRCPWIAQPKPTQRPFDERSGMLYLGGFKHLPNVQALQWFVQQVMPLIELPAEQKKLRVVGSSIPDHIRDLASPEIEIVGYLPELEPAFDQARVFVAPLRYGAGLKGKVIEAMAYGLPLVATTLAAESTPLVHGVSALLCDEPASFAGAVTRLATDPKLWSALREKALAAVRDHYSVEHGLALFSRMLDELGVVHLSAE